MSPSCSSLKRMTCSSARLIINILRKMPSCFSFERSGNIFPPKIYLGHNKNHSRHRELSEGYAQTREIYCLMGRIVKRKNGCRRLRRLTIELRIVAKDAFLVERQASRRCEISGKPWARRNSIVERDDTRTLGFQLCHPARKGVTQAGDHLEHR